MESTPEQEEIRDEEQTDSLRQRWYSEFTSSSNLGYILRILVISLAVAAGVFSTLYYLKNQEVPGFPGPEPDVGPSVGPSDEPDDEPDVGPSVGPSDEPDDEGEPYDELFDEWSWTNRILFVLGLVVAIPIAVILLRFNSRVLTYAGGALLFFLRNIAIAVFLVFLSMSMFMYYIYYAYPDQRFTQFKLYWQIIFSCMIMLMLSLVPQTGKSYIMVGFIHLIIVLLLQYGADFLKKSVTRWMVWTVPLLLILLFVIVPLRFKLIGPGPIALAAVAGPLLSVIFISSFSIQIAVETTEPRPECKPKTFASIAETEDFKNMVNADSVKDVKKFYRKLATAVHPDRCTKDCQAVCETTFISLGRVHEDRLTEIEEGMNNMTKK